MTKRNLIIIHRGPAYERDFDEIAAKVHALDRNITVYHLPDNLKVEFPVGTWQHPTLTVSLSSRFRLPVRRGPLLKNYQVEKLAQQEVFRKNGIATPPALPFRFGMRLDPIVFGEYVVLKPSDLRLTSTGRGIHLLRRRQAEKLTLHDFPVDHPIRINQKRYIVQRFIDTGEHVSDSRVATFFGRVLYANTATARNPMPALPESAPNLLSNTISGLVQESDWCWRPEPDMLELAKRVHAAFPNIPLLGTDILREARTGRLYVLECNPGGNTWHFSSVFGRSVWQVKMGRSFGASEKDAQAVGRKLLLDQFNAFDLVAEELLEKTQELAA
jgi:hypothetical protein